MPSATTSNFLFTKQMNYLLKSGAADWQTANIYIALLNSAINLANDIQHGIGGISILSKEVATTGGTNYARVLVGPWTGPGADANLTYSNTNDIVFGAPGANWGTIQGAALFDGNGPSANLLYISELTTPKTVNQNDGAPKILAGQLKIVRATCP